MRQCQSISDLPIQPTAAYLLSAPSVPDEARQRAVAKAEAGEEITPAVAKEIVAEARKKRRPGLRDPEPVDQLGARLFKTLRRFQERWPGELLGLARQLREFADCLDVRAAQDRIAVETPGLAGIEGLRAAIESSQRSVLAALADASPKARQEALPGPISQAGRPAVDGEQQADQGGAQE